VSMKLWGGRFEGGPSEAFQRFSWSLEFDKRFLEADVRGSQAFARELARVGILSQQDRDTLIAAFEGILGDSRREGFFDGADDEDVHTLVIRKLKERVGTLADKIHTGRSRNEQVSLDARLWLRGEIDCALERLTSFAAALLGIASRYPAAIIPGYTHTRRAQAVLWPHYILAYFEMFARDRERLLEARKRVNVFPLGSGALAGSGFQFEREAMAQELGFDAITANSMDVSADRDYAMDFLYAASMLLLHLSRLAEDWILYSGEEYGWMELGDGVTSGSSLMPQKKNPDSLELIRGKAGRLFGDLTSLFITLKGTPMTYNRDFQECWQPLFDAVDQVQSSLEMASAVVETATLMPAVASQAADEGWVIATDLAEALARNGTPFHQAHQIAGRLVLASVQANKKPADWTAAELTAFAPEFTAEMIRLFDPAEGMRTREIPGGTGPETVASALRAAEARLAEWRS
jgi:argininosuccinate lyase